MIDPEKDVVERVLTALGKVEAPAGMDRRILARMEQPDAVASDTRWRSKWLAGGLAFAAMLVIAIATPRAIRYRDVTPVAKKGTAMPKPSAEVAARESKRKPVQRMGVRRVAVVRRDKANSPAAEEVRAKSFPAPPMPLTEEEQLLLHIAHGGDRKEYALLNSGMEAARDSDERAEFRDFFMEPPFLVTPKIDNNQ